MFASTRLATVAIRKFFAKLPKPRWRHERITHPLMKLIFIALCAMLAGADSYVEDGAISGSGTSLFG